MPVCVMMVKLMPIGNLSSPISATSSGPNITGFLSQVQLGSVEYSDQAILGMLNNFSDSYMYFMDVQSKYLFCRIY
ncbi:hypothetical protein DPMN_170761 [Dreissena polymorpha]|uniref:Uncharacterized protein n=1 Tax=Dreissena polymorpha TaxID=45954 RepID=A0A9D4DXY1_DREPO|nr:hypothetical protein DPMN_170761 [Dreissena polymorpha]